MNISSYFLSILLISFEFRFITCTGTNNVHDHDVHSQHVHTTNKHNNQFLRAMKQRSRRCYVKGCDMSECSSNCDCYGGDCKMDGCFVSE